MADHSSPHEAVRALLAAGAGPDAPDHKNRTALHRAAGDGDLAAVRLLLLAEANPNCRDDEGATPLHMAAWDGSPGVIRLLLNAGADPGAVDEDGITPLARALSTKQSKAADLLCNYPGEPLVQMMPDCATASPAEVSAWIGAARDIEEERGPGVETPLQRAVLGDKPIAVRLLLEAGAEANGRYGVPLSHLAVQHARPEILWLLHDAGSALDMRDGAGRTALLQAAMTGRSEHVRLLLDLDADPNAVDVLGWGALHAAAFKGDCDMAQNLTEKGARHDLVTTNGELPITLAGPERVTAALERMSGLKAGRRKRKKHSDIPKRMSEGFNFSGGSEQEILEWVRSGGDPNLRNENSNPPLFRLAEIGSPQGIKELLDCGASCGSMMDPYNCTPLGWAAWHGNTEGVRALLDAGADVEGGTNDPLDQIDDMERPLQLAAMNGHAQTVQLLLHAGAGVNAISYEGTTALHAAVAENEFEVVKLLVEAGAELDIEDRDSNTPLHIAASRGDAKTVALLLAAGADPSCGDANDGTVLHRAAYKGHSDIVKLLVEHSPWLVTFTTGWDETPLHLAAWNGNPRSVGILFEHGAAETLNAKGGENGNTPLHLAVARGNSDVEMALIEAGADTTIKNDGGRLCADMRDEHGCDEDDFDF